MDATDRAILDVLAADGRASAPVVGRAVHLSAPAVAERVRRLEAAGAILGYTARLARAALGAKLLAFVTVQIDRTENIAPFREAVVRFPCVLECHHLAGQADYLLKVAVADTDALEEFLSTSLKKLPGVTNTTTSIVLSTLKETVNPGGAL